jgi:3-dehydroquinate dehydratase
MAYNLHECQHETFHVHVLLQSREAWLVSSLLQGGTEGQVAGLASQGYTVGFMTSRSLV